MDTPADTAALDRDINGKEASGSINYASVVGMLIYIGHSQPKTRHLFCNPPMCRLYSRSKTVKQRLTKTNWQIFKKTLKMDLS